MQELAMLAILDALVTREAEKSPLEREIEIAEMRLEWARDDAATFGRMCNLEPIPLSPVWAGKPYYSGDGVVVPYTEEDAVRFAEESIALMTHLWEFCMHAEKARWKMREWEMKLNRLATTWPPSAD